MIVFSIKRHFLNSHELRSAKKTRLFQTIPSLIDLMKNSPVGTVIRYSNIGSEFVLSDLDTKNITKVSCARPDSEAQLKHICESNTSVSVSSANPQLRSILSTFGLSDEDI